MAWEWSALPTCLPNGPASTRCSGFRRNSSPLHQLPDQSLSCKIIRLSADAANPLSRSRNSWADGDGWVGLHLMQVSRGGGLKGVTGFPVSARSPKTLAPLSSFHPGILKPGSPLQRLHPVSVDRARERADPHPYMDKAPVSRVEW